MLDEDYMVDDVYEPGVSIGFGEDLALKTRVSDEVTYVFLEVGGILDAHDVEITLDIRASFPTPTSPRVTTWGETGEAMHAILPEIHMTKQLVARLQGSAHPNIKRLQDVAGQIALALVRHEG